MGVIQSVWLLYTYTQGQNIIPGKNMFFRAFWYSDAFFIKFDKTLFSANISYTRILIYLWPSIFNIIRIRIADRVADIEVITRYICGTTIHGVVQTWVLGKTSGSASILAVISSDIIP